MKCFLVLLLSLISAGWVSAQVQQEWAVRYHGPVNGTNHATAMALDVAGNVYVTGYSQDGGSVLEYATVNYDTAGKQLWVARYHGTGNTNVALAVALDATGNVYVTGYSQGGGGDLEYATVKYDSQGNELWVARYHGPVNGNNYARAMALDATGNLYVTGASRGVGIGYYDYATVKYDSDGNQLWVARYGGSTNGAARAIAVDGAGNVYVTGGSPGLSGFDDYATLKYDSDGNQLWVTRYHGPGDFYDVALAMALDATGNVYVTGYSRGMGLDIYGYVTVKYDSDGNQLWVARYDDPREGFGGAAGAIALDAGGNVYVTGEKISGPSTSDYVTVKYDTEGNELWMAPYHGPSEGMNSAYAIALDAAGSVYVTGGSEGTGLNYATVKYDSDGNEQWVARYADGSGWEAAQAIALDAAGNVYVTGESSSGQFTSDYATVKYTQ